ncbi:hypothetical protein CesoFtcFv8_010208 [Champsocephalus esox]|uniref:Membrane-spanning 4-domains subfamily A member 15 n=1 Tax=Champsocephalus esox TaxID=159716 RepID=A0AAN8C5D0_9TELE|nr:hypothetical protein CesoFtcFv8_010208 [Champsocephalus esox]
MTDRACPFQIKCAAPPLNKKKGRTFPHFLFPPTTFSSRHHAHCFSARTAKTSIAMEGTESTTRERSTAKDGNKAADQEVLSSKPLHRFVQREPRNVGIAILIFGCAEVMMGFTLSGERGAFTSFGIYTSFWQGTLFLVCGGLSIYTELRPSKKMMTVCLSILQRLDQIVAIEALLFTCSLFVAGLLIFLCVIACLALKSTRTQIIVRHIPAPPTDTTAT